VHIRRRPGYITLFFVKQAAQLSVGSSKYTTVALIGKLPINGASTETNDPLADPQENPFGSADTSFFEINCMYSSLELNSGREVVVTARWAVELNGLPAARTLLMKPATGAECCEHKERNITDDLKNVMIAS